MGCPLWRSFSLIIFWLHCIAEIRAYWVETKPFEIDNPRHHYQIAWQRCLCLCSRGGRFSKDFSEVRHVGWEVEGLSLRLNGWQQYCARNYEMKCKLPRDVLRITTNDPSMWKVHVVSSKSQPKWLRWRTIKVLQAALTKSSLSPLKVTTRT